MALDGAVSRSSLVKIVEGPDYVVNVVNVVNVVDLRVKSRKKKQKYLILEKRSNSTFLFNFTFKWRNNAQKSLF